MKKLSVLLLSIIIAFSLAAMGCQKKEETPAPTASQPPATAPAAPEKAEETPAPAPEKKETPAPEKKAPEKKETSEKKPSAGY